MDYLSLISLLDKIPYEKVIELCTIKKKSFMIHNKIVKKDKLLNSFGSYNAFIWATKRPIEDICILKFLVNSEYSEDDIYYCLIGRIGIRQLCIKYINWWFKYFYRRSDLDLFRRIYITFKKAKHVIYRNNFKYSIDIIDYFKNPDYFNKFIKEGFELKKFKRLDLYTYTLDDIIK